MGKLRQSSTLKRQAGFTLVELSIVLVIIGLLIGGILAARSMIQWSKMVSLQTQMTQMGIQVSNFKSTFGAVPGEYLDAMTAWPDIRNGAKGAVYCNNRVTAYSNIDSLINSNYDGEGAFAQLYAAGMIPMGRPQIYQDGTSPTNWTCMANNMQQSAGMKTKLDKVYGIWDSNGAWTDTSGMIFGENGNPAASSEDTKALDVKFDDGMPNTGLIRGRRIAGSYCNSDSGVNDVYYDLGISYCAIGIAFPSYYNQN